MAKQNSNQSNLKRRPMSDWQVEQLRFTAFTLKPTPVAEINWWNNLTRETPKTKTQRPRDGTTIEEGPFNNGKLVIQSNPIRIDFLFVPDEERQPRANAFLLIGALPECLDLFIPLVMEWFKLDTCPDVQRIALGAILRLPVPDKEAGYRQLSFYLPSVDIDSENSFDFLYQINRPILSTSGISELRINRLNKWAVSRMGMINVVVAEQPKIHLDTSIDSFSCRLELDINTHHDWNKQLPSDMLPNIFNEFGELTKQIVKNGDTP